MAKEFTFILGGNAFAAAPVKLERKKIYGWSSLVATDRDGHTCTAAYISPEDSLMIPAGAAKMATVDENGLIVKKSDLIAFDADGKELETFPSSFDSPIDLLMTATEEEFLDHEWSSVYQIQNTDLASVIGNSIYTFPFSYSGGTTLQDGFLLNCPSGLFLFAGTPVDFAPVSLGEEAVIDECEEEVVDDIDELDFSMI
jgi:hypothetical protein